MFFWIFPLQDPVLAPKEDDGLCHCCLRWDITKSNAWAIACIKYYQSNLQLRSCDLLPACFSQHNMQKHTESVIFSFFLVTIFYIAF